MSEKNYNINNRNFGRLLKEVWDRTRGGAILEDEDDRLISALAKFVDAENDEQHGDALLHVIEQRDSLIDTNYDLLVTHADDDHLQKNRILENAIRKLFAYKFRVEESKIVSPPGRWMQTIASTVFPKKTMEEVFDQIVGDFRDEYCEALHAGAQRPQMFFVIARHWIGFIFAVAMQGAREVGRLLKAAKGAG